MAYTGLYPAGGNNIVGETYSGGTQVAYLKDENEIWITRGGASDNVTTRAINSTHVINDVVTTTFTNTLGSMVISGSRYPRCLPIPYDNEIGYDYLVMYGNILVPGSARWVYYRWLESSTPGAYVWTPLATYNDIYTSDPNNTTSNNMVGFGHNLWMETNNFTQYRGNHYLAHCVNGNFANIVQYEFLNTNVSFSMNKNMYRFFYDIIEGEVYINNTLIDLETGGETNYVLPLKSSRGLVTAFSNMSNSTESGIRYGTLTINGIVYNMVFNLIFKETYYEIKEIVLTSQVGYFGKISPLGLYCAINGTNASDYKWICDSGKIVDYVIDPATNNASIRAGFTAEENLGFLTTQTASSTAGREEGYPRLIGYNIPLDVITKKVKKKIQDRKKILFIPKRPMSQSRKVLKRRF